VATLFALLAAAGPAAAGTFLGPAGVDFSGDPTGAAVPTAQLVSYYPDPSESPDVVLSQTATDLVVTAASAKDWRVDAPCVADSATTAHCPLAAMPPWFVVLRALGAARPRTVTAAPSVTVNLYAQGTAGQADRLTGGAGDDVLIVGDQGVADGGTGNDHLSGLAGGPVGTLRGSEGDDVLLGGADADGGSGADDLTGGGAGAVLHGGSGNDSLTECPNCASSGALLSGDGGNDTITGRANGATLDGGDGADTIDTLSGRTATTPRVADPVRGGDGNDTIDATDLVTQTVDCGDGTDTVQRDRGDKLVACEKDLGASTDGGTGAPDGGGGPGGSSPSKGPAGTSAAVKIKGSVARLRASSKGVVAVTLTCPAKLSCAVKVGLKRGKTTLASTTVTFKATKTISLKLKPKTLAALRRAGSLKKLTLQFTAAPRSGTRAMPKTQTITLLAPKKAKAKHR
jgi:hypothetical protein